MKQLISSLNAIDRRKNMLDCAWSQFRTQGYVEASVSDIARAADISAATIYKHFKNKLALFEAVLEREVVCLCEALDRVADEAAEGTMPFALAIERLIIVFTEDSALVLIRLVIAEGGIRPSIRQSFRKAVPTLRAAIRRLLEIYSRQLHFMPLNDARIDLFIETLATGPQMNLLLGLTKAFSHDHHENIALRVHTLLAILCHDGN